ncbi:PAS domain-containing sensor histidine kinase [Bacteroidota bacterium]
MGFNKYVLNIIIRSLLIAVTALVMVIFAINLKWIFTFSFICILFILQIILLVRYVSKVNRDLANFLIHLKEQNTTINFSSSNLDKTFGGLTQEFERINEEFKKIENEKIQKQHLLNLLLDRVGTGILLINKDDDISLYNNALINLLGIENKINKSVLKEKVFVLINECPNLKVGEQNIVNTNVNNITRRILIALSEIKENGEIIKIYSFHDIDREMTDYELQSWNGLIKVLAHEIMNTLTPMSTAVDTLKDCIITNGNEKTINQLEEKDIKDTIKGINLLDNRIRNLQNFIKKFRQYLDIPVPELKEIRLYDLFNTIIEIYKNENISIEIKPIPETLTILADKDLLELVFINIIKNAIEANATEIAISANHQNKQTLMEVQDNGNGIESSILKKVFLPFYTTKKDGSGIGLSLARQIMFLHGGNIVLESNSEGTIVKLFYNKKII